MSVIRQWEPVEKLDQPVRTIEAINAMGSVHLVRAESWSRRWTSDGDSVVTENLYQPLECLGRRRTRHGRQLGLWVAGCAVGDEEPLEAGRRDQHQKSCGLAADPKGVLAASGQIEGVAGRH